MQRRLLEYLIHNVGASNYAKKAANMYHSQGEKYLKEGNLDKA